MKLLVDLGNSRIKWAWLAAGGPCDFGSAPYDGPSGYAAPLASLPCPAAIAAISVAHHHDAEFMTFCRDRWGRAPVWYGAARAAHGVVNSYEPPEALGVDRFAALVGARRRYPGRPVCVADCGTAITVDGLDAGGVFRGGIIAPGLTANREALRRLSPVLAAVAVGDISTPCGRNTADAAAAGLLFAAAGLIERVFREQATVLGPGAALVLTGGDGERVGRYLPGPHDYQAHLTLEGLAVMAA